MLFRSIYKNPFPLQTPQGNATFLCTKNPPRKSNSEAKRLAKEKKRKKKKSLGARDGLAFEFYPFRFADETNRFDSGGGSEVESY